ncbi:MAG: radical SAM family heme chaperone HemW, partial [Eggerthellaceae bacterium]|nr:radical SAM family heme chaperone HemW [Eggerthellaceae bacterium]
MFQPYKALYLHLPFCKKRCAYCDFETRAVSAGSVVITEYMDGLIGALEQAASEGKLASVETLYLGGGTPSHVGTFELSRLLEALALCLPSDEGREWSMEANPESISEGLLRAIFELGINRLSIGVQSFNDDVLKTLGRIHSAEDARNAVLAAKACFENVSIDLMCGIPGQSFEDFDASLREAIALEVSHVSVYPLTIEDGTPFAAMQAKGQLAEIDQDFQALMMQMAASSLEGSGLKRYEVASYAREGFECRHNSAYWKGLPYL